MIAKKLATCQKRGVPLVAIRTPDPRPLVPLIKEEAYICDRPIVIWDSVNGMRGVNDLGEDAVGTMLEPEDEQQAKILASMGSAAPDPTKGEGGAASLVELILKAPVDTVILMINAHRYIDDAQVMQGIHNSRDYFKSNGRVLVLIGVDMKLPVEIKDDAILIDEPSPNQEEIGEVVDKIHSIHDVKIEGDDRHRAIDACLGLHRFSAEQAVSICLDSTGMVKLDDLWETKIKMIEQTDGLSVHRGNQSFDSVGGVDEAKSFLSDILKGRERPGSIVFIDEIEKLLGGSTGGDSSGVSQDQLRQLLVEMEKTEADGLLFVGHPGTAKTLTALSAGNLAGVPTIDIDLGAMKGSLVGESEQMAREAFRVARGISGNQAI